MYATHKIVFSFLIILTSQTSFSHSLKNTANLKVDFYDSMSVAQHKIPLMKKDPEWGRLKKLYDKHIKNGLNYIEQRIPKIIHQVWLGSPYPEKYRALQKTWIEQHPDWEYKLWTDKDIENFGLINKKMYDATPNYGAKSDIARYEILYRFGGLYVDTDFECLQPFDILNHCLDFYTGMAYGPSCVAFVALIGAVPKHPILKECIESLNINKIHHPDPAINILFTTGPYHFSKALNKHTKSCKDACVAFPVGYFYPWPNEFREENKPEQIRRWIRPETFAIHHWYVSWNNGNAPGAKQTRSLPANLEPDDLRLDDFKSDNLESIGEMFN